MTKRRYTLGKRASSQEDTRQRIVEATVQLHQEVGPRETTISAIAEKAQVQRLTVYRHFPDEEALFAACTTHWFETNPPPSFSTWNEEKRQARIVAALYQLYSYYRRTERMFTLSYRDEPYILALHQPMNQFRSYLDSIRDDLIKHVRPKRSVAEEVRMTLGHAVQFSTWQSLAAHDADDKQIPLLVCAWLEGILNSTTMPPPH
ncbi:TetR/AcrR family transcriptional regulator [Pseudomonas veronii]|uniref:TetR/AcrR family transcriptional regulator n=1 Tax=Pseudomonas veronii TaxID=76761 RepID=UPI002D79EDD6|nr:TetR/AcrR family transcriptional regulator [Pseudomonas veronii]WRU66426.1 TetR/AcrR family transcriptional regulator [Pseudomonas veronii]